MPNSKKFISATDTYSKTQTNEASAWKRDRNFIFDFVQDHIQKAASYGLEYCRIAANNTAFSVCESSVTDIFNSLLSDLYCAGYDADIGLEPQTNEKIIYITWGPDSEANLLEHMGHYHRGVK